MKITPQLTKWLTETKDGSGAAYAVAGASDEQLKQAGAKAIIDGTLSADQLVVLTADEDGQKMAGLFSDMSKRLEALEGKKPTEASYFEKVFATSQPEETWGGDVIRVKGAHERYAKTKSALRHPDTLRDRPGIKNPRSGLPVYEGTSETGLRQVSEPSELDHAISGAFFKFMLHKEGGGRVPHPALRMNEHEKDLIQYALREEKWGGVIAGGTDGDNSSAIQVNNRKLKDLEVKAILDDSTSGGLEIAPIVFDDNIIQIPLLYGELFPMVNVVPITRGRRIEGGSIGTVTLTSGGADGTDIPLFSTASFIAAFDTTIFACNGAIEIGLDFLSDSPIDVGRMVTQQYGEVLLKWLDEQVAVGDGSTQPEGIMSASGTTSVSFSSAAPTVAKYLSLLFGVDKAYKKNTPMNRLAFASNETSYLRARQIATGVTGDTRLVFGMEVEDYMLFQHPYAINEAMANTQIFFANMSRYRMYRRLGLTVKSTTEGKTLVRQNMLLITARARYGGQLEDGAAAAVVTDAQA